MSYGLEIVTHLKPQRNDIAEALPEAAKLSGVFGGGIKLIRLFLLDVQEAGPRRRSKVALR